MDTNEPVAYIPETQPLYPGFLSLASMLASTPLPDANGGQVFIDGKLPASANHTKKPRIRRQTQRTTNSDTRLLSRCNAMYRAAMVGNGRMTTKRIQFALGLACLPRKHLHCLKSIHLVVKHEDGTWEWVGE